MPDVTNKDSLARAPRNAARDAEQRLEARGRILAAFSLHIIDIIYLILPECDAIRIHCDLVSNSIGFSQLGTHKID